MLGKRGILHCKQTLPVSMPGPMPSFCCKQCGCPQGAAAANAPAKRPRTQASRPPRADVSSLLWCIGALPSADAAVDAEAAALLLSISCGPQALPPSLGDSTAALVQPGSPAAAPCGERELSGGCSTSSGRHHSSVASGAGGGMDRGGSGGGSASGAGTGVGAPAGKPFRCLGCGGAAVLRGEKRPTFHCAACLTAAGARKRAQRALFGGHVVGTAEAAMLVKSGVAASALPQARPTPLPAFASKAAGRLNRGALSFSWDCQGPTLGGCLWRPGVRHGATGAHQRAFISAVSAQEGTEQRPQAPVPQGAGDRGPSRTRQERCKCGARLRSLALGAENLTRAGKHRQMRVAIE